MRPRETALLELFHCSSQLFYLCLLVIYLPFLRFQLELLFLDPQLQLLILELRNSCSTTTSTSKRRHQMTNAYTSIPACKKDKTTCIATHSVPSCATVSICVLACFAPQRLPAAMVRDLVTSIGWYAPPDSVASRGAP